MMRIASFLAVLLLATTAYSAEQPNVLFIVVDDLRPELGCYGNKHIQSPHIDALAQHSVLFSRAYCQQAVCNPSRASLLTGLRPDSSKVWDLVTHFRDTVPDVVTLPQHFRQHGYAAVAYGKIYHNPLPDKSSWDEPNHWPKKARAWSAGSVQRLQAYREKMRAAGKSETAIRRMRAPAIEDADVPDNARPDGEIADQAITAMQKLAANDKPFFLAVGFVKPHLPFNAPRRYWDLYDPAKIPLADNPQLPAGGPAMAMNTMYELRDYMDFANTARPDQGALSEAQQRRLKHGYYAAVSYSDAQVGRLMAELDRLKLRKNTVVVLWGDHGWKLGEHRSWCKQTNYEIDTRVPLMISTPGDDRQNASCKSIVEFVDVYPTLCELAGLPAPEHLQGTSLLPLLSNPDKQGKNIAVSQFPRRHAGGESMGYAVRTSRYRYVEWLDRSTCKSTAVELYDHQHDPQENTNIAKDAAQKAKLAELSAALWKHIPRPQPGDIARPPRKRPVIRFKNLRSKPVELFWIGPNGRVSRGHIKPGNTRSIKTTKFHQFQFEGGKPITVRKPDQTIVIQEKPDTASAKEKLEADYWLKVWLNPQSQKAERSAIEKLSGTSYLHYHIKVGPEVDALLLKRGINYTHWESRLTAIRAFQATFQGSTPYPGQKRPLKVEINPILRIYQDGMNDPHPKVRAATMEALADMAAYLDESTVNGIFNPQKFIEADPYLDTIVDLAITKGIVDANTKVADAAHHTILMAGSPRKYWLRSLRRVVDQKLIKTTDYHKRAKEMLVEWERDVANIKPPPPPKPTPDTPNPFAEPDPPVPKPAPEPEDSRIKPVVLFGIGPNGRVTRGHIKPGNTRSIKTTKFHQFQFEGGKPITVRKPDQTIVIQEKPDTASAKEKLEADYWLKVWLNPKDTDKECFAIHMLFGGHPTAHLPYIKVGPEVDALLLKRGINYSHWKSRKAAIYQFQETFSSKVALALLLETGPPSGNVGIEDLLPIYRDGLNDPHPEVRAEAMRALGNMAGYLEKTVKGVLKTPQLLNDARYLDVIVDLAISKGLVDANTTVADEAYLAIVYAGEPSRTWLRSLRRVVDQRAIKIAETRKWATSTVVKWERAVEGFKPPPPAKPTPDTPNPFDQPDPPERKPAPEPEDSPFR